MKLFAKKAGAPAARPGINHIFRRQMAVTILCGFAAVTLLGLLVFGGQARTAAKQVLSDHLSYIAGQIEMKNQASEKLQISTARALFEKAYAVQQILRSDPSAVQDEARLGEICTALDLSQLDITDSTGAIVATWPAKENYLGLNFADFAVTQKYMTLITCKNLRILEDPRQNAALADAAENYVQYAGVARLDEPGILQVGQPGTEYDEALENASVESIAPGYVVQNSGFVIIASHNIIVSAGDESLLGKSVGACGFLPEHTDGTAENVLYQGRHWLAAAAQDGEYKIYAFLPAGDVYQGLTTAMLLLFAGVLCVLLAVFAVLSRVMDRTVVSGIRTINAYLGDVSRGDLGELADVRTTAEMSLLSDGINAMVQSLRRTFAEKDARISTAIEETERVTSEREQYRDKARREPMTGLLNRAGFAEACAAPLQESRENGMICALLMLDHDHFKMINDTWGHDMGDRVLCRTAELLQRFFRENDIIARVGGDEFCVFVPALPDEAAIEARATALAAQLLEPLQTAGGPVVASCSIGIAIAPRDGTDVESLYKSADKALYRAKANGRARWCGLNDSGCAGRGPSLDALQEQENET